MDLEAQYLKDLEAYERGELVPDGRFPHALRWAKKKVRETPSDEELAALVFRVEMKVIEILGGSS
jgi:hypothetical protein